MDHFEKMATAEFLEGRMKELEQFHDGLSSSHGDEAEEEIGGGGHRLNRAHPTGVETWTRPNLNYLNESEMSFVETRAGWPRTAAGRGVKGEPRGDRGRGRVRHEGDEKGQGQPAVKDPVKQRGTQP